MNWLAVLPEIVLLTMACVVTLADLWVTDARRAPTYWLTQLSLAVVAGLHLWALDAGDTVYAMQDMVVADPMGHLLAAFSTLCVMATLAYSRGYTLERGMLKGELFTLSMFSLLGVNVIVSANNFLVIYVGLELMTLSLYALTALRRDDLNATEAAMKFFVLGALASGFLLYGLSMMYGATGSLHIPTVFETILSGGFDESVLVFGVVFVVAGLAFKLGAVPFHMWLPDVYHGAPTAVTLLIATAPMFAGFGMMIRLLVEGMFGLAVDWQQMLVVLAIASLTVGNLAAIAQRNLKRMLAYSTIGQMGFVLLGLTVGLVNDQIYSAANGYSSALYYMVTYVLTTLGTFGLIMLLARRGFESEEIDDFKGLARRSPWFAAVMGIFMFSLAGVPPTMGFYAKFAVLQSLLSTNNVGYFWLAGVAILFSLVGAFYYLRVVKVMYFDEAAQTEPLAEGRELRALLSLNGVAVLVLGLLPGGLMTLCTDAIVKTLST